MKADLTHVTFLLDSSGSMGNQRREVVGGYNEFVEIQKHASGECVFRFITFNSCDSQRVVVDNKPIAEVSLLSDNDFDPNNYTPMWDAIGIGIRTLGKYLSDLAEDQHPSKVVFVIFTDGIENASKEFGADKVKEMITHQREVYKWEFIFLGQNIDSLQEGAKIGTKAANSADVHVANARGAISRTSEKLRQFRASGQSAALHYDDEDRKALATPGQ